MKNTTDINSMNKTLGDDIFWMPWWQQFLFITAFIMLFVVATVGNLVVIWIVLAHKRMRTVTNFFIVNLAVADALISILNTLFTSTFLMYQDWWYGVGWCKFTTFISICTVAASVLTLMAIAIDRYFAIVHPLRRRPTSRIFLALTCIWSVSTILALPNLLYGNEVQYENSTRITCILVWPDGQPSDSTIDLWYNVVVIIVSYVVPMIILIITYTRVGLQLWGSKSIGENTPVQFARIQSKKRVVKMMIFVVVVFGICWLPYHLYFVLVSAIPDITLKTYMQQVYIVIYWIAMSNSMYNPIIYCWMNNTFRRGFIEVFCSCPCKTCKRFKKRQRKGRQHSPAEHFAMMERCDNKNGSMMHSVTYYNDDQTRKNGTEKFQCFSEEYEL